MERRRTNRAGGGLLTLKRIASWIVIAAAATTFAAFWHFLVFHSDNPEPPVFWVYSALAALVIAFSYVLISLLELVARRKCRFRLNDMLAAMTVVAVVLGAIAY